MSKVREIKKSDGTFYGWAIFCPACGYTHIFDHRWTFNGSHDSPTFTPSMLVTGGKDDNIRCHSFVTDGQIQFLGDCAHAMRGQTVPLEDLNE